jgi:hypothetical protein
VVAAAELAHELATSRRREWLRQLDLDPARRRLDVGAPSRTFDQMEVKEGLPAQVQHRRLLLHDSVPRPNLGDHVRDILEERERTTGHRRLIVRRARVCVKRSARLSCGRHGGGTRHPRHDLRRRRRPPEVRALKEIESLRAARARDPRRRGAS